MDKNYVEWKRNARAYMGEWWVRPPLDRLSCLVVHFYGPARGDLDNRIGAVMDAGLGLLWSDDNVKIINAIAARHFRAPQREARIYMKILWPVES
jgi:Holliday junction resolvase RusA-like endonuclease